MQSGIFLSLSPPQRRSLRDMVICHTRSSGITTSGKSCIGEECPLQSLCSLKNCLHHIRQAYGIRHSTPHLAYDLPSDSTPSITPGKASFLDAATICRYEDKDSPHAMHAHFLLTLHSSEQGNPLCLVVFKVDQSSPASTQLDRDIHTCPWCLIIAEDFPRTARTGASTGVMSC